MAKVMVIWLRRNARAFTLIELLVVIAIIGILAGMLLPALTKARERANAARCVSNMHQWSLAINMYNDDWNEYYPYDGDYNSPPCAVANDYAWFNVLTPYIGQKSLCTNYAIGHIPSVRNPGIFVCMSGTNKNPAVSQNNAVFYYSLSTCMHRESYTNIGFRRDRMVAPSATIVFCEEPEDVFPETNGQYDTVTRHSGGSNFVLGDGHVEWIPFFQFCRAGNPNGCPSPLGDKQWDESGPGGDWSSTVPYHWWFFEYANTDNY
jgi:prepilin-type N-terminal cleavage/methylation domain-containing protein/prepilin-type processing-associated H-X9-DG protein